MRIGSFKEVRIHDDLLENNFGGRTRPRIIHMTGPCHLDACILLFNHALVSSSMWLSSQTLGFSTEKKRRNRRVSHIETEKTFIIKIEKLKPLFIQALHLCRGTLVNLFTWRV